MTRILLHDRNTYLIGTKIFQTMTTVTLMGTTNVYLKKYCFTIKNMSVFELNAKNYK